MIYLGKTKEGTEIYREAKSWLCPSKPETYRTEERKGQISTIHVGIPQSELMRNLGKDPIKNNIKCKE